MRGKIFLASGVLALATLLDCETAIAATDSGLTVQFVARHVDILPGDKHEATVGHAFIILGTKTQSGVKEDVFCFYPNSEKTGGIIKGPGMLRSEMRCAPSDDCNPSNYLRLKRMSEVDSSISISITAEQRSKIYSEISAWDSKPLAGPTNSLGDKSTYQILDRDCITFVSKVAADLGYPVPYRLELDTPVDFVRKLADSITKEEQRRVIEAQAAQARAAQEKVKAERKKAKAEEQRRLAEEKEEERNREAEARSIPAGWIPCTCQGVHSHTYAGKWIDGQFWHAGNLPFCPR